MYKAIVFAGTTEGYALCEFLAENHVPVYACAATEYGGSLLKENEFLRGRAPRKKDDVSYTHLLSHDTMASRG